MRSLKYLNVTDERIQEIACSFDPQPEEKEESAQKYLPAVEQEYYLSPSPSFQYIKEGLRKMLQQQYQRLLQQTLQQSRLEIREQEQKLQTQSKSAGRFQERLLIRNLETQIQALKDRQLIIDTDLQIQEQRLSRVKQQRKMYQKANLEVILDSLIAHQNKEYEREKAALDAVLQSKEQQYMRDLETYASTLQLIDQSREKYEQKPGSNQIACSLNTVQNPYQKQLESFKASLQQSILEQKSFIKLQVQKLINTHHDEDRAANEQTQTVMYNVNKENDQRELFEQIYQKVEKYKKMATQAHRKMQQAGTAEDRRNLSAILEQCKQKLGKYVDKFQRLRKKREISKNITTTLTRVSPKY